MNPQLVKKHMQIVLKCSKKQSPGESLANDPPESRTFNSQTAPIPCNTDALQLHFSGHKTINCINKKRLPLRSLGRLHMVMALIVKPDTKQNQQTNVFLLNLKHGQTGFPIIDPLMEDYSTYWVQYVEPKPCDVSLLSFKCRRNALSAFRTTSKPLGCPKN